MVVKRSVIRVTVMTSKICVLIVAAMITSALRADTTIPPPSPAPDSGAAKKISPNQVLADIAREAILKSLKPEYDKQDNWGHQKEIVDGYHWVSHSDGWHLEKQTKKVNEGLWRSYRVRLDDPRHNLKLRFTDPKPGAAGRTAFQAILAAKLNVEARQEQWVLGVKGLNFQVAGDATVEAKLDIQIGIEPVKDASFGTIQVDPRVNAVHLRLVDLTLKRVDIIHGDAAKEIGNAMEDIIAGELRKREPDVTKKINAEIAKHRDKLQFSPSQIAQIGWDKVQALLGAFGGEKTAN